MPDGSYITFSTPNATETKDAIPEVHISVRDYNKIGSIKAQHDKFNQELVAAGITKADLFTALAPIFRDYGPNLALYLVHRHFELRESDDNNNERMVSRDSDVSGSESDSATNTPVGFSEPAQVSSANTDINTNQTIFPERWLLDNTIFEYTRNTAAQGIIPTRIFMQKLKEKLDTFGNCPITVLGVCVRPPVEQLERGHVFVERSVLGSDRTQATFISNLNSMPESAFEAVWVPSRVNRDTQQRFRFSMNVEEQSTIDLDMVLWHSCVLCDNSQPGCQGDDG